MQIFKTLTTALAVLASMTSVVLSKPLATSQALQKRAPPTSADIDSILTAHNVVRAKHNAPPLKWNQELGDFAYGWASKCSIAHSQASYGENIAWRTKDWTQTVNAWYSEVSAYNYSNPGFSTKTGHFTQVVWKNTKTIGCGASYCDNIQGVYYVCEYFPRGNVLYGGADPAIFFRTNVTAPA
ncbi:40S ribosomal protein S25 [Mucor velutinosus]|uniref:40S ribosomal protein S25 n=1 Tax=Mucor velutinosus TaxID=708070 RepID=A0AAN7HQN8_9FUNG|nr:40S ribosomal protein S25 [Mucor velutinosus]